MPWDFETQVTIDPYEVLDYVRDNQDWFLEQLDASDTQLKSDFIAIARMMQNTLDKYDYIRRKRDESIENQDLPEVKLYEELLAFKEMIEAQVNE